MKETDNKARPKSWIQGARSNDMPEWIKTNPRAFRLLYELAERSRREEADIEYDNKLVHLCIREFITGRKSTSQKIGISEQEYRTLYKRFEKLHYIKTINATKQFTIGKYLADDIFYNNYPTNQPSIKPSLQPIDNQQPTTNNNEKNEKKEISIHTSTKVEREENSSNKKKCPNKLDGHKGCVLYITSFAENRGVKFANFGKQINALHKMLSAGYSFEEIDRQIELLEKDKFWHDRGFDLMNVANEIGKGGYFAKTN